MTLTLQAQLDLATEFRIPCTNETGGYAEVVVERSAASRLWAVTDGSFTGRQAWHDGAWHYVSDIGRATAYRHSREDALALGQQVAQIEGTAIDARVAALRAQMTA